MVIERIDERWQYTSAVDSVQTLYLIICVYVCVFSHPPHEALYEI